MAKYHERLKARELRKSGKSIGCIAKQLSVSKSSVSLWCRDIVLTNGQVIKLMSREVVGGIKGRIKAWEWHRREKRERMKKYNDAGYKRVKKITRNDLFLLGLSLYWAEGSKKNGEVSLVNSDPRMILVFIKWLRECFNVKLSDLTCRVGINESHKDRLKIVEKYWSDLTELPLEQFRTTSLKKVKNKKVYANHNDHFGSLVVRVKKSTNMYYEILGSIAGLKEVTKVECEAEAG